VAALRWRRYSQAATARNAAVCAALNPSHYGDQTILGADVLGRRLVAPGGVIERGAARRRAPTP
jgi:hypothetical protein